MHSATHEMTLGTSQDSRDGWFEKLRGDHGLLCGFDQQDSLGSAIKGWTLGDVRVVRVELAALQISPVGEHFDSWQGHWLYVKIITSGWLYFEQFGYQQRFDAGGFFIVDPLRPFVETIPQHAQMTVLRIPKSSFTARGLDISSLSLLTPDLALPDVQATRKLINCVAGQSDAPSLGVRQLLGEQLVDLVSLTLLAPLNGSSRQHPLPTLFRARRFIQQNLGNEQLTIEDVARSVHLSGKHLQRLFRAEGTSLMRYVWDTRLEKAHARLQDRSCVVVSIQEVAWQCGFASAAHFSRVFKEAYGQSPSEFRRSGAR